MKDYDFILAGGGAAGLSLALRLLNSPLKERSILIVDQDSKDCDDRTFGYWTRRGTPFDHVAGHSWERLRFAGETTDGRGFSTVTKLGDYRYHMLRGLDLYRYARREISAHSNVDFLLGRVSAVQDGPEWALVRVGERRYAAQWVFDSISPPARQDVDSRRYHYLRLLFKGWEIETQEASFDSLTPTLMDFRTPQKEDARFFYLLPYSPNRALVEYTLFTKSRPDGCQYQQAMQIYIRDTLGIDQFRIVKEESGGLPVSDQPVTRRRGQRVLAIGANGGMLKPTTGYAFTRIQRDSQAIVESLLRSGHPFDIPGGSSLYRALDAILLEVMAAQGERIKPVFSDLFRNNPIQRILRFLDEEASLVEVLALMASLPVGLFLETMARSKKLRRMWIGSPRNPAINEAGSHTT
jgi:lycopene beta-cyclase